MYTYIYTYIYMILLLFSFFIIQRRLNVKALMVPTPRTLSIGGMDVVIGLQ